MVGERIKKLRLARGLTQTDLALMLGIKQPKISEFERGKRKPNKRMVLALSVFFKVSVIEIDPDFKVTHLGRALREIDKRIKEVKKGIK